ncbi:Hypothetical protein GbCGDNIH2_0227 [Granulibacter bethesdensis]|uniref:Uncharacterized protein n=3 Tax=Granulibacter bethesdensis TaxID=364410 RepID=Q0BVM7_GRABC|nr:hypothetical protein [Granulibacter bethesdensis]ABI61125.1 Hypothetical protein GbCGDNIH1_0227 [Granulibacter bethesdensis CGDNIH1]AHJ64600.1 Hypothetical protein GbCGDNIH4_0227 [Granulibacter bethesdensis CGDNIH4]AHJ61979.1 Hypothetical protein GbCGDNIH3_0227 [Granulibacter bethesdensis]AHJ67222.1 Hypothetical protein GbCGDNIH2_0227 [Granulibacter bethesdensis]APH50899.1 Hypothetical protein GbCGDNIH5_0227 [Granulibacter bethesdensis]
MMITGSLYDGEGIRLEGDGPDLSPAWVDDMPFKILLQNSDEQNPEMLKEDRYWYLAKEGDAPVVVPKHYVEMLAGHLKSGKKLAVISDDPESASGICNMILLICRSPGGTA